MTPLLRASLSRTALMDNCRRLLDTSGAPRVADLRRDAWGHGLPFVADVLCHAGISHALVDAGNGHLLRPSGMRAVEGASTLDMAFLYGLPDTEGTPVMRLSGQVLSTKRLLEGEGISYNHTHHARADTRVALIAGGFGQGIPRALGNHAHVEIGGAWFPVVGRVAMDVNVVDVGDAPVTQGDEVVYFGGSGPARTALRDWERVTGWTAAALVCAIGLRVPRQEVL